MHEPCDPAGPFVPPDDTSPARVRAWIDALAELPSALRACVAPLSGAVLDTPYREGGWTARQVVHHVADSHLHAYLRMRFALAEDRPTILPYDENRWAALDDARRAPVTLSLDLLDAVHARWCMVLSGLEPEALAREFVHPELGAVRIDRQIAMYAWHGPHHLLQVRGLVERMGAAEPRE